MSAYYNEIDPFAAAWLRELIKAGLIADGEVDERSIADVRVDDLRGFRQCHFFAGIAGWSLALRLAGWDDARPVWTGSCPCQPFSSAGAQAGGNDSRDLWPVWFQLVKECRPVVVFGEQVEAAIGHGWLDRLCDDLESENYAVGAVGLPGPCVGAFDIRQRLWFVADAEHAERWPVGGSVEDERDGRDAGRSEAHGQLGTRRQVRGLADADERLAVDGELQRRRQHGLRAESGRLDGHKGIAEQPESELGHTDHAGPQGRQLSAERARERAAGPSGVAGELGHADRAGREARHGQPFGVKARSGQSSDSGFWRDADWLPCADGKARPVEPGTFPLAHGVPARVGRLRGYGNAIKPQVAQAFIEAYMSVSAPPAGSHGHRSDASAPEGPLRRQEADAETTTANSTPCGPAPVEIVSAFNLAGQLVKAYAVPSLPNGTQA